MFEICLHNIQRRLVVFSNCMLSFLFYVNFVTVEDGESSEDSANKAGDVGQNIQQR